MDNQTEISQSRAVPAVLALAVLAIGVGLGLVLPALAELLSTLLDASPFPVPGVVTVIADLPRIWSVSIVLVLAVIAAGYIAYTADHEALALTVAHDHVEFGQKGRDGWINREDVSGVYLDGRFLVFLNQAGIIRHRLDADALSTTKLSATLRSHGYPWTDADPYESAYVTWVEGRPEFDECEHALLRRLRDADKDSDARAAAHSELAAARLVTRRRQGKIQARRAGDGGVP